MKRAEKGITLIALIITIIVMLILAGVTVTSALNGGLFNTAKDAVDKTRSELEKENKIASGEAINKYLPPVADDWSTLATELPTDEEGNYHIETCAELAKFAEMVNGGNDFSGETVYLDANLNLQGNANKQWTPIGIDWEYSFNGTFDGQNHYISGIYIDTDATKRYGLFAYVGECEDTNVIKNLGIKDSTIKAPNGLVGGVVGYNQGVIINCYNEAEITGGTAGGITGVNDYRVSECYNIGTITGRHAGGIAADNEVDEEAIQRCYNKGTIIANDIYGCISGISANLEGAKDCYNMGELKGTAKYAFGIANGSLVVNCYNCGNINMTNQPERLNLISSYTITNSYCLSESPVEEYEKTSTFMKSQEFVDLLNNGRTGTEAVWKMDTQNINNGFPILSWQ